MLLSGSYGTTRSNTDEAEECANESIKGKTDTNHRNEQIKESRIFSFVIYQFYHACNYRESIKGKDQQKSVEPVRQSDEVFEMVVEDEARYIVDNSEKV